MRGRSVQAGSAMIIATIVTLIVVGMGGAFLAYTVSSSNSAGRMIEADEASFLAEAGLEKARRALYVYRTESLWSWNDILVYCADPAHVTDPDELLDEFLTDHFMSSAFVTYRENMDVIGVSTANDAPLPGDPDFFFGEIRPYSEGGFHVLVYDNDDGDGDPLTDSDLRLVAIVTSFHPDGTMKQLEAHLEFESPTFSPDAAIIVDGTLLIKGTPDVTGTHGSVHANIDLYLQGNPTIAVSGSAAGTVHDGGVAPPPGGWNSDAPSVPLPDIDPMQYLPAADYIMMDNGQVRDSLGNLVASGSWGAWKFSNGTWSVSGNEETIPGTYFVYGDFKASGAGNAPAREWTVIATGSITTTGNVQYTGHMQDTLFLAGTDLKLTGTSGATMEGFSGAHEQLQLSGTVDYKGSIMAKDAEDLDPTVSTGSSLDEGATTSGTAWVDYNGGLETLLENPSTSVKIVALRKLR